MKTNVDALNLKADEAAVDGRKGEPGRAEPRGSGANERSARDPLGFSLDLARSTETIFVRVTADEPLPYRTIAREPHAGGAPGHAGDAPGSEPDSRTGRFCAADPETLNVARASRSPEP